MRLSTIFLQNKYGGECRHGGTMNFCSVLSFPASKHQEKISILFLMEFWTSGGVMYEQFMGDYTDRYWFGISASSVIYISFVNFRATSLVSISYIFPPTVVWRTLFLILNIRYELTILVWVLQQSYMGVFIKPIFYFAVRKFVCKPRATTNIYGRKYRIQGQFSKSQGKFSSHFASHILGLSV